MKYFWAILFIIFGGLIQTYRILPTNWEKHLMKKIPSLDTICFFVSFFLIVIGCVKAYRIYIKKEKLKVFASPADISVIKGTTKKFTLNIANNLDYAIYEVCLEISIANGDINLNDIVIDPLDKSNSKQLEPRYWYIVYELKSGKSVKLLFSDYIAAHSIKEFSINADSINCTTPSKINFKVISWAKSPSKFEVKHNKEHLPEKFDDFFTKNENSTTKKNPTFFMKIKSPKLK